MISQDVICGVGREAAVAPALSRRVNMSPNRPYFACNSGMGISASKIAMRGGVSTNATILQLLNDPPQLLEFD